MSSFESTLLPPDLDLSTDHVKGWWGLLPRDFKAAVGAEIPGSDEEAYKSFSGKIGSVSNKRYTDVVRDHADLVAAMGRPRRVRFLAWVTQVCWPESDKVLKALTGTDASDEGSSSSGGVAGGRSKVASLFLSDLEAIAGVVCNREVRAVAGREAVRSVESGVKDFEDSFDLMTSGAM